MSLNKIIERKNREAIQRKNERERQKEIINMFREYIISKKAELDSIFPCVLIGKESDKNVLGVSYSQCIFIEDNTHNIVLDALKPIFSVGFAVSTVTGHGIKFDYNMNKTQLRKVFKQTLEMLVSKAYWPYWEGYKKQAIN